MKNLNIALGASNLLHADTARSADLQTWTRLADVASVCSWVGAMVVMVMVMVMVMMMVMHMAMMIDAVHHYIHL